MSCSKEGWSVTQFEFLEQATRSLVSNQRAAEVRRELLAHLNMKVEDLIKDGVDPQNAHDLAMQSLGDPEEIARAYQSPVRSQRLGWRIWGAIPLLFAAGMTLNNPIYALLWIIVVTVVAIMAEPGLSLNSRISGVVAGVTNGRLLVYAGAVAGLAAALGTLGPGGPVSSAVVSIVEFVLPLLVVLYVCWQGDRLRTQKTPYAMVSIVSAAFLVSGVTVFSIGHWDLVNWQWISALHSITTVGVLLLPLLLLATALGWETVEWLRRHDLRSLRQIRTQRRRDRQDQRMPVGSVRHWQ